MHSYKTAESLLRQVRRRPRNHRDAIPQFGSAREAAADQQARTRGRYDFRGPVETLREVDLSNRLAAFHLGSDFEEGLVYAGGRSEMVVLTLRCSHHDRRWIWNIEISAQQAYMDEPSAAPPQMTQYTSGRVRLV